MENQFTPQQNLPNANAILILGIASIIGCCCYSLPGIICGVIALVLASSSMNLYKMDPSAYTQSSYNNINAGKICAWIGLVFSMLYIVMMLWMISFFGWETLQDPEALQEAIQNMQR